VYAGHVAIATLVNGKRPSIPLAWLVPVAFGPDWVEWLFGLAGRQNRALSHSIPAVVLGALLAALVYALRSRRWNDVALVALTWMSHWPADFITGSKPTWPGGPDVGLMLYEHLGYDAALESLLVFGCWLVYRASLPERARRSRLVWLMPAGLVFMQAFFRAIQEPRFTLLL
jgi:hypothetical protein